MAVQMFSHIHDPGARVRALCDYGSKVDVEKSISPKLYLRSGREMIRMANVYLDEGNLESAFILYSKYITLFVEKLPKHPDYKSAPSTELGEMKRKVKHVFPLAEEIKNKLKIRYAAQEKERQTIERKRQEAVEKEAEKKRLEEEKTIQEQAAIKAQLRKEADEKWRKEQEERYRELQGRAQQQQERTRSFDGAGVGAALVCQGDMTTGMSQFASSDVDDIPPGTPPPPYNQISGTSGLDSDFKKMTTFDNEPTSAPSVDRSTKPPAMTFDHFTSIGGGGGAGGLREVTVPTDLMRKFIGIAQSNTDQKIETLGILFGSLAQNQFHITHLFIPQQQGTPDSCDMENEVDLINYQDQFNLINLGWIHTHPTQTAFLSSVDLHSHYPYQIMMPEAVAIVCSPKYNETGIFRLTNDRGLSEIGDCSENGFHYHTKEPPLFESCPHVKILDTKECILADYRKK